MARVAQPDNARARKPSDRSDPMTRGRGNPSQLAQVGTRKNARTRKAAPCRHSRTTGEWLSAAHVAGCLGVPRKQLLQACTAEQIRFRVCGLGHKRNIQVWATDVRARWPKSFSEFSDPPTRARVRGKPDPTFATFPTPSTCAHEERVLPVFAGPTRKRAHEESSATDVISQRFATPGGEAEVP